MRLLLLLVLATAACDVTQPTPVWMPGSPPLTIWAETDRAWEAMSAGCQLWRETGLRCKRVDARDLAQLEVDVADTGGAAGEAEYRYGASGWTWSINLDPVSLAADHAVAVAAHELGHTMGIIEHLPAGNLMAPSVDQQTPTDADFEALADVWGEAPWLE